MVQIAYAQSHTQPSGAWGRGDDGSWSPDNPTVAVSQNQIMTCARDGDEEGLPFINRIRPGALVLDCQSDYSVELGGAELQGQRAAADRDAEIAAALSKLAGGQS
jgi:hypothetical protein